MGETRMTSPMKGGFELLVEAEGSAQENRTQP